MQIHILQLRQLNLIAVICVSFNITRILCIFTSWYFLHVRKNSQFTYCWFSLSDRKFLYKRVSLYENGETDACYALNFEVSFVLFTPLVVTIGGGFWESNVELLSYGSKSQIKAQCQFTDK